MAGGYNENQDMRMVIPNPKPIRNILDGLPEVEAYTFRGEAFSLVSSKNRTYGILVTGIHPESEARVSTLKNLIRKGSYFSGNGDREQGILGALLADNLNIGIDDEVTLLGQGRDGSVAATMLKVKGVFRSGIDEMDRYTVYMHLDTFQEVYFMRESVHRIVINMNRLDNVLRVKQYLQEQLKVLETSRPLAILTWKELKPGLPQSIKLDMISGIIWYLFLILVVAFSIMNTFLMAIFERTKEFGVMLALGTKPKRLVKILLIESMSMTAMGLVIGMVLGSILTLYFQEVGIDLGGASEITSQFGISGKLHPRLSFISLVIGPSAVLVITFFAALYPALKARKLNTVETLAHR
jgi:ABC-type lipoprotein release transport system permease subunit